MQKKLYTITIPIIIDGVKTIVEKRIQATSVTEGYLILKAHIQKAIEDIETIEPEPKCICQGFYKPYNCPVHGRGNRVEELTEEFKRGYK